MGAQSGAFSTVEIGADTLNTITDISQFVMSSKTPRSSKPTDLTTFGAGGQRATTNQVRGAGEANITLEVQLDPATYSIAEQIAGYNTGVTFRGKTGRNAAPGQGDALFTGTYCLVSVKFGLKTGSDPAKMTWDLRPAVNGAIIPAWVRI